ncbi:MAG: hypothetical protein GY832_17875 [Chloroflexi bacterium]|nr:hypothetical protein [Chloroflexota bacterium]
MNTTKRSTFSLWIIILVLLITACGQQDEGVNVEATVTSPPPPTAPATEVIPTAIESGFITGIVHGQAPPTPPMVVYAVDNATSAWAVIETSQADGAVPYTLEVQPGSYLVFACPLEGESCSLGYSDDAWTLAAVTVAAGQTIEDIVVRPPSQSECGSTFGLPASPDGRFAGVAGPSEECREAAIAAMQGDFLPLNPETCTNLSGVLSQNLGFPGEMLKAPFDDYFNQKTGTGCQTIITFSSQYAESLIGVESAAKAALESLEWQEDIQYAGGGAGGMLFGYRKENGLCILVVSIEPADNELCSQDEPLVVCMDRLTPEQKRYTVDLNCAQDPTWETVTLPKAEPARIEFAPGAISAQVMDNLAAGGLHQYVLNAAVGQEMTVNLVAGSESVTLIIWGLDGTVLARTILAQPVWVGVLPLTQDYFIDIQSVAQEAVDYVLEVTIPSAADTGAISGLPRVVPPEFQPYMQSLVDAGVPPMLPPEFPVEQGLLVIYPYLFTVDVGEYELSLDYGEDCQGAGACHYGSMSGKQVDSSEPMGTRTFPFDIGRARTVALANGITGYFSEAVCMANCNDATVYWIYNGYQYMVGLKAGPEANVVALANAAILNFEP